MKSETLVESELPMAIESAIKTDEVFENEIKSSTEGVENIQINTIPEIVKPLDETNESEEKPVENQENQSFNKNL